MRTIMSGLALAAMVALAIPVDAVAQRGTRGGWGPGSTDRSPGVEMVMRLRDRLELSDQQIEHLEALRQEVVERRTAHQAQMSELRSRVVAGEMTRDEFLEIAQARREGAQEVRDQDRDRMEAILSEDQLQELETLRAGARGFAMGRASAARGGRGPAARGFRSGADQGRWCGARSQRGWGPGDAWGPGPRRGWGPGWGPGGTP